MERVAGADLQGRKIVLSAVVLRRRQRLGAAVESVQESEAYNA